MTGGPPRVELLNDDHDLSGFACGNEDLDDWLQRHAVAAQRMDSARTFALTRAATVIGYFSLTMGSVLRQDAPVRLVRGLPGYPVGMVLLARLAVDESEHGNGHGGFLLAEALVRAVTAGESVAARLVVVDAIEDEAVAFYEHFGFTRAPEHPRRLYRRTQDIRASLDR